jgi:protein-S-isoprenylcysteine O-methyltransferase Ste14
VGLAVAAVVLTVRERWTLWLAAVYSAVTLLADGPHQVPELVHPTSVFHTVGAVLLLVAGVAALLVSVRAATATWPRSTPGLALERP